jgi:hypothetical protein
VVSDLIEKYATPQQIEEGFDLADFLKASLRKCSRPAKRLNNPRK